MREPIRDKARLEHILQAIDYIRQFTDGVTEDELRNDVMRRFAVIKNLEIIGEASYMLTKEFREKHSHIPWRQIINMRHILNPWLLSDKGRNALGHYKGRHPAFEG